MPMFMGQVVSDAYLQAMLGAYRQGYFNAGGPDVEDSDGPLLTRFAQLGIDSNSGAAALGAEDARIDIANKQAVHITPGFVVGAALPAQQPKNPPPVINTITSGQDASLTLDLQGLPQSEGSVYPNRSGASLFGLSTGGPTSGAAGGGFNWTTLLIIAAIGGAIWYLMKRKK